MKKVLVSVEVPNIAEQYDVYIPKFYTIKELVPLLAKAIEGISNHRYVSSKTEFLCIRERNLLLKEEYTLEEYGIKNGEHLILL